MVHLCDKPCGNKTASGYCATTACINPQFSNIGTTHYGQGVQKHIITNADRIRSMSDEELAEWLGQYGERNVACHNFGACDCRATCIQCWLDWLRQEADT